MVSSVFLNRSFSLVREWAGLARFPALMLHLSAKYPPGGEFRCQLIEFIGGAYWNVESTRGPPKLNETDQ